MNVNNLIDASALAQLAEAGDVLIVDCRFDIADPTRAERDYIAEHIPGAHYAHLDRDLSDLSRTGQGRHPLPEAIAFSKTLSRWGWTRDIPVVVYDAAAGALAAARLWWMLRLIGQRNVAVLDGGIAAWTAAGLPLTNVVPDVISTPVSVTFDPAQIIYSDALNRLRADSAALVLDARAGPRYRGEVEPIDPVAGHVPGAENRPFSENLTSNGRFKSASALREEFARLLGARKTEDVVHMCGSGVTACHNLLAMEHAGLSGARVYAPSWSGWISDPSRPVAQGD